MEKGVGGGDESRKQGSSKWLMDMVTWNLENSLRKDMITVCFLVHSFIHASTPTSFGSNVISISTTTLVKLSLQPSALLIHLPLPYFFFSFLAFITFQYTILCCYLLCLVLVSPHKTVSQVGVLVTTVLQHLEQCLVVNTHLLTERMRELKHLRSLRCQARS